MHFDPTVEVCRHLDMLCVSTLCVCTFAPQEAVQCPLPASKNGHSAAVALHSASMINGSCMRNWLVTNLQPSDASISCSSDDVIGWRGVQVRGAGLVCYTVLASI